MQSWLTILLLLNGIWGAGESDAWDRLANADHTLCEQHLSQSDCVVPIDAKSVKRAPGTETHWYEAPNPLGLEVFTHKHLSWMADDTIGLRYTGPLRPPFASQLRELLMSSPQKYNHVILELDSDGGELRYVEELVVVLQQVRKRMELTTRVMEGSLCASGCIPLFMQGQKRKASGSSIWVFHGARAAFTNFPNPDATDEYLNLLQDSGMTAEFRSLLEEGGRIYKPGSFIFSGYELFSTQKAGIITDLFPTWREEKPILPAVGVGPH